MLIRTDAARGLTLLCRFRPPVFFNLRQLRPFQAFERSFRFYAFVVGINVGSVAVPKHVRFCGGFCSVQIQLLSKLIDYTSVDPKHDFVMRPLNISEPGTKTALEFIVFLSCEKSNTIYSISEPGTKKH